MEDTSEGAHWHSPDSQELSEPNSPVSQYIDDDPTSHEQEPEY